MRLLHLTRAAAVVGQSARQFLKAPSFFPARPVLCARAFTKPATSIRTQTRLSSSTAADSPSSEPSSSKPQSKSSSVNFGVPYDISGIPGLWPPWQFQDLSHTDQKAYHRHGARYREVLLPKELVRSLQDEAGRRAVEENRRRHFGENWYATFKRIDSETGLPKRPTRASINERKVECQKQLDFPRFMPPEEKMRITEAVRAECRILREEKTKVWMLKRYKWLREKKKKAAAKKERQQAKLQAKS